METPKHEGQGDFATNFAMIVAGKERRKPREVAEQLAALLRQDASLLDKVEIAGPGFVNLFLNPAVWSSVLAPIAEQGERFGLCDIGKQTKAMVEFVSANPTGPLTVGHGRNAVLGDAVASLLTAVGWNVTREYYFNDAGRQMCVLGASLKARYLGKLGLLPNEFPEDGYQGGYMYDIAQGMIDEAGDSFKDADFVCRTSPVTARSFGAAWGHPAGTPCVSTNQHVNIRHNSLWGADKHQSVRIHSFIDENVGR